MTNRCPTRACACSPTERDRGTKFVTRRRRRPDASSTEQDPLDVSTLWGALLLSSLEPTLVPSLSLSLSLCLCYFRFLFHEVRSKSQLAAEPSVRPSPSFLCSLSSQCTNRYRARRRRRDAPNLLLAIRRSWSWRPFSPDSVEWLGRSVVLRRGIGDTVSLQRTDAAPILSRESGPIGAWKGLARGRGQIEVPLFRETESEDLTRNFCLCLDSLERILRKW